MNKINELLNELDACDEATEWAKDRTWEQIFNDCHRGDWLLWLFKRTNADDLQRLTLAKGHCANTVRHLMKDERSIKAVDVAIQFGEGFISLKELNAAAYAAYAAAYAASSAYAAAAAYAASAYASASDAAAYAAYAAAYAARKNNQQQTADICRQYLPIDIWNIKYDTK